VATAACGRHRELRAGGGFTLIELMVVVALIAVAVALVSLAMRDGEADRLERDAVRLATLLETARAEARASGLPVRWLPASDGGERQFRFVGLPAARQLPERWLDEHVVAQVVGSDALVLGPDAILAPQRVRLQLGEQRLTLATDGLAAFALDPADSP
jgi:general secretion pathway protein H